MPESSSKRINQKKNVNTENNEKDKDESRNSFNASISSEDENLNDKMNSQHFRQEVKSSHLLKKSIAQMYNIGESLNTHLTLSSDEESEQ